MPFLRPRKLLHSCKDETYKQGDHELTGMQQLADQVVRYDLDDLDVSWLDSMNAERLGLGKFNLVMTLFLNKLFIGDVVN